ncbi:MAG: transcriptional regulator MntR [bacterium]
MELRSGDFIMKENNREEFHTFRGYTLAQFARDDLSASMEDYLEMIYRLSRGQGQIRVNDLARALNVQPPSVTKMVKKLAGKGFLEYERYGVIQLTDTGREMGRYLLDRHNMLEEFLRLIGVKRRLLENVERIEHNLTPEATQCLFNLVDYLRQRPEIGAELSRQSADG